MLQARRTVSEKRAALRAGLAGEGLVRLPGAHDPLVAMLIERKGFEGVYISGGAFSASLGLPDIGLTTLSEVAQHAARIARVTDLPVLADADTGFGAPLNVARTVQLFEDAGVAGIHIEDQVNPKRCGHLDGKEVVDTRTATRRITGAIAARRDPEFVIAARTDIRGVADLPTTIARVRALAAAGADVIFPEALTSLAEFEAVVAAVNVPVLANITEFGKSELFSHDGLKAAGVRAAIHPVSSLRIAMGAVDRALDALDTHGTLATQVPAMLTRAELYDLLDYAGYAAFDEGVFTFDLANNENGQGPHLPSGHTEPAR